MEDIPSNTVLGSGFVSSVRILSFLVGESGTFPRRRRLLLLLLLPRPAEQNVHLLLELEPRKGRLPTFRFILAVNSHDVDILDLKA